MVTSNSERIARNTLMLYFRMLLTMVVSLYTIRVVLDVLGQEGYGIYAVVGGVATLLAFLPGALASATQRFFSFALGQADEEKLKKTFTANLVLYGFVALGGILILETIGLWFINNHLNVPAERLDAARTLYQYSVASFVVGIFNAPFMAIIIAHEDMHIYAYMSIGEALLKLVVVFLLTTLPGDKLELYGLLLLGVTIINTGLYIGICMVKYAECRFRSTHWDLATLREIVGFTGWTIFGQLTTVARNQAVTILLNQTFNPAVVAARAVATNLSSKVLVFSSNFNTGLYPPIVKAYANGDTDEMHNLVYNGSKITFFLMWVFGLPLLIHMKFILALWLGEIPTGAVLFAQLALVESLISAVSLPVATAARAHGKMRLYELSLGLIQLAIFFGSWIVLGLGGAAYSVFVVAIVANMVMFFVRLAIVHKMVGILVGQFIWRVIVPIGAVAAASTILSVGLSFLIPEGMVFDFGSLCLSGVVGITCIYFIGLDAEWRRKIPGMILKKFRPQAV